MSEWNLSVRLTGQGSDLARTLRTISRDARTASRDVTALRRDISRLRTEAARDIRIRVRADARGLRSDVRTALSTAGSGQRLGVRLGVDARRLRSDVQRALTAAGAGQGIRIRLNVDAARFRSDVRAALTAAGAGQNLTVDLNVNGAAALATLREESERTARSLNDLQGSARDAGNQLDVLRNQSLAAAAGLRSMNRAAGSGRTRLDTLSASTRTFRSDLDDLDGSLTNVTGRLSGLRGRVGGLSGGSGGGALGGKASTEVLKALLLLAPAAIPLVAGLTTNVAALTGQFATGAVAAGAFGAAVAGQVAELSEAADAQKKYEEAVAEHGVGSLEAAKAQMAYQRQLASMPAETQHAAVAVAQLRSNFSDWSDDMAQFTMQPVTKGITILDQVIPRLTPQVKSFSSQLDRVMNVAGGAITTPGFDALSNKFADFTDRQLDEMTDDVIHFLRVLSEGGAIQNGPLAQFMDYARENGPEAREALRAIGQAVVTLMQGAAQAGPSILTLVTAAAKLVAALPPELVGIIIQVATALKLLQLSGAGIAALAATLGRVRTAVTGVGAASAAAGGGVAGLAAAFAALGTAAKASVVVAGIAAVALVVKELSDMGETTAPNVDKLTTSLGDLGRTGKATGYLAQQFGADFGKLNDSISKVTDPSVAESINNWGEDITGGLLDAGDATEEFRKNADSIDKSLENLVRSGNAKLAKAALKTITEGLSPKNAKELRGELDGYKEALADLAFEQKLTADSQGVFGAAVQRVQTQLEGQKASADGLRASLVALNETNRSAYDSQIAFEASLDNLSESFAKNGANLDISTKAGQANGQAMSAAAKAHDEMIASGLAAGESLGSMTAKSDQLRSSMMKLAVDAFDGNRRKATEYVNTLLGVPGEIKTHVKLERQQAMSGLQEVQAAIFRTPGAKRIVVSTLNAAAIAALEAVGLKTEQLPDGKTAVFTANGAALSSIGAVRAALDALDGKTAHTYTTHHETTVRRTIAANNTSGRPQQGEGGYSKYADGGVVDFYANGGLRLGGVRQFATGAENHVAQIAPAGSWRVWGEPETQGEGYVPFARSKRVRSRAITEEIVRRLGGDPQTIQWNANGSVTDWRYDPTTGSLYSGSDITSAGKKTKKVKVKGKGGKVTTKEVEYFDLGAVERKLRNASKATQAWNKDLEKVADRVGGDVAEALASMGEEGMKLADKMANGSTKYINDMAKALRDLQKTAKASLTDYTRQLTNANKVNKEFADDLANLAAMGYGDLAAQLAEQNDLAAQQLADAAVKDKKKAAAADKQAKTANNALTADQVQSLVQIVAAIKTNKTGIHDVAATTGLGEDEIIAIANKARGQIHTSLGSRATKFLQDLSKANKFQAYADGGIRAGMYATRGGIIRFAEPETHGEAFLPLAPSKRRSALPVLHDVATRFGLGLTDARATRPVVIVRESSPTNVTVTAVRTGASASDIASQVGRSVRRARRGGVAARAA